MLDLQIRHQCQPNTELRDLCRSCGEAVRSHEEGRCLGLPHCQTKSRSYENAPVESSPRGAASVRDMRWGLAGCNAMRQSPTPVMAHRPRVHRATIAVGYLAYTRLNVQNLPSEKMYSQSAPSNGEEAHRESATPRSYLVRTLSHSSLCFPCRSPLHDSLEPISGTILPSNTTLTRVACKRPCNATGPSTASHVCPNRFSVPRTAMTMHSPANGHRPARHEPSPRAMSPQRQWATCKAQRPSSCGWRPPDFPKGSVHTAYRWGSVGSAAACSCSAGHAVTLRSPCFSTKDLMSAAPASFKIVSTVRQGPSIVSPVVRFSVEDREGRLSNPPPLVVPHPREDGPPPPPGGRLPSDGPPPPPGGPHHHRTRTFAGTEIAARRGAEQTHGLARRSCHHGHK